MKSEFDFYVEHTSDPEVTHVDALRKTTKNRTGNIKYSNHCRVPAQY